MKMFYTSVGRGYSPKEIALMNMVDANIKMIRDALPSILMIRLTTCCPTNAAIVATQMK